VPNRPSQRARIRFLLKSSALEDSDHCTPDTLAVGVDHDGIAGQHVTPPAAWLTVATTGTPNSRRVAPTSCRPLDVQSSIMSVAVSSRSHAGGFVYGRVRLGMTLSEKV
jgi:hypothetical protein